MRHKSISDQRIKYWAELAEYDLKTAAAMLKMRRYLYVGFMCHQTMEKTLKAYYVKTRKATPPYRHNLGFLSSEAGIADKFSKEQHDILDELEPLNIESRYPTHKNRIFRSLNKTKCARILKETRSLYKWLRSQL